MSSASPVTEILASAAIDFAPPPPAAVVDAEPVPLAADPPPLPPDLWRWRVHFLDGTLMDEVAGGYEHTWSQVNWQQIRAVELIPQQPGLPNHALFVDAQAGERAVFLRRRQLEYNPATGEQEHRPGITVLGWTRGELAAYTFFHADGGIISSSNLNQV